MLKVSEMPTPPASLADLSRNASVISTSSSSSASELVSHPLRALRPLRPFSAPRRSQSRDPSSPGSPRASSRPPAFLTRELAVPDTAAEPSPVRPAHERSRVSSLAGRVSINDFTMDHNAIGEGSYSEVLRGTHNITQKVYAIKIVDKKLLMREGKVATAHAEKYSLSKLGGAKPSHPGVIKLQWTFQDDWSLYFVLDLAPNGDLQSRIFRLGSLSLECSAFYMAQVLDGLQWMHTKGVLHRDMKPENILLDADMRVKITDFGTSKSFDSTNQAFRATTWVGTAQYIPPELIIDTWTCKSSDIWAIGCMLFQCLSGNFPFVAKTQYLMWEKVKKLEFEFPDGFDADAKDLICKILVLEPSERLGAGADGTDLSPQALRDHSFFAKVDWPTLWTRPVPEMAVGMYARPPDLNEDGSVYDPGAAWDALADDDNIPWLGESDGRLPLEFVSLLRANDDLAPHEMPPRSDHAPSEHTTTSKETATPDANQVEPKSRDSSPGVAPDGGAFPKKTRGSFSTTISSKSVSVSASSSSDTAQLDAETSSLNRDLSALAIEPWLAELYPDETPIFTSAVTPRPNLRQRASSIIPSAISSAVPPIPLPITQKTRSKRRQLVLTTARLLCLKLKDSEPPSVKAQILFQSKRVNAERKSDNEFVVSDAARSYTYLVENPALAARWVEQIGEAMDTHRGRRATRR